MGKGEVMHVSQFFLMLLRRNQCRVASSVRAFVARLAARLGYELSLLMELSRHSAAWTTSTHLALPNLVSPSKKLRRIPLALREELAETAGTTKGQKFVWGLRSPGYSSGGVRFELDFSGPLGDL